MIDIIFRPLLVSGMLAVKSGSLEPRVTILIDSQQPTKEQTIALFHELLHLVCPKMSEDAVECFARAMAKELPYFAAVVSAYQGER